MAWPLGLAMMLLSLNTNIPRYFIEGYLGERELGIFAGMAYVMVAGSALVNAIGQTVSPRLAKYWADDCWEAFRHLLLKLIGFFTLIGVAGIAVVLLVGPELLAFLYGPEYAARSEVFVWLMVCAAISYIASAFGYGMTAARLIRVQSVQFICATTAGIACCMLLIPRYGLNGAAWAAGASLVVQLVIGMICLLFLFYPRQSQQIAMTEITVNVD
jgi:O-antigen/teichoic acid export membrane protein